MGSGMIATNVAPPPQGDGRRRKPGQAAVWLLAGVMALLTACAETPTNTAVTDCRNAMDINFVDWSNAVDSCTPLISDSTTADLGRSYTAQALMGRAGVSLLDLLTASSTSALTGMALMLDLFAIDFVNVPADVARYADVARAVTLMGQLSCVGDATVDCSGTDLFNMVVASDVALTSLFKAHLNISIDSVTDPANPVLVVPGVTDAGLDALATLDLTDTANFATVGTTFNAVYTTAGSYYKTLPLSWLDAAATVDLQRVSDFVRVNGFATTAMDLAADPSLAALDFSTSIDNGQCGYAATVDITAPGTATTDGAAAAKAFPRRLNTSEPNAYYLGDELYWVLMDVGGATNINKEWGGTFALPSALLNPDFFQIDCDGTAGAAVGEFSTCMEIPASPTSPHPTGMSNAAHTGLLPAPLLNVDVTLSLFPGNATGLCGGGDCLYWPLYPIEGLGATDGDGLTIDESILVTAGPSTQGADAMVELAQVLDTAFPINNTITTGITGTHPAYACAAGDGLVHYREYDYYLRSFGQ